MSGRSPRLRCTKSSGDLDNLSAIWQPKPKNLDEEIKRLISQHGWEKVAKSAKKWAKPNKRREMENIDFLVLGSLLQEEVEKELAGLPTRLNSALAEAALPFVHNTEKSSTLRRLLGRLASHRRRLFQATLKLEHAAQHYPCSIIFQVCHQIRTVKGLEAHAAFYLDEMERAIADLAKAGRLLADDPTLPELRQRAMEARNQYSPGPLRDWKIAFIPTAG